MPDTPTASGADLARQALAAARAAAKTRPAATPKKRRTVRPARGEGRDPLAFGDLLKNLKTEQGWETGIDGGNLIDQWPTLCPPELATTVRPTAYDPDRGLLTLQPSTPAYATQVRLFQQHLIRRLNEGLGRPAVRTIRVLPPGGRPAAGSGPDQMPDVPAEPKAPAKTRETASPGYREALEAALAHKPDRQPTNPYVLEAIARQEEALRRKRQPEHEHRDAYWAQLDAESGPRPGSMAASEQAARAYARRQAAAGAPRRAFDVA